MFLTTAVSIQLSTGNVRPTLAWVAVDCLGGVDCLVVLGRILQFWLSTCSPQINLTHFACEPEDDIGTPWVVVKKIGYIICISGNDDPAR